MGGFKPLAASQDMAAVAFRRHFTLADSHGLFDIKTERPEAGPHDLRGMFATIIQARAGPIQMIGGSRLMTMF